MREIQLAINTVTTRQHDFVEAINAYAAAGFRNVEFVLPLLKSWLAEGHTLAEVRQTLSEKQLRCIGGFETHIACFGSQEEQRANHDLLRTNATLISKLGGGTLVVGTDGPGGGPSYQALDEVASVLGEFVKSLEGLQVSLALEFNWSPVVKSLLGALYVVEKVNHPQLGILFDPAHYHCTPTKLEHLDARSIPWIKHVHVNDMRAKPGELSDCNADRVLPGEGMLDLHTMFALLEQHSYNGYYSIELFNEELWQKPTAEAAQLCYQSLLPFCEHHA